MKIRAKERYISDISIRERERKVQRRRCSKERGRVAMMSVASEEQKERAASERESESIRGRN